MNKKIINFKVGKKVKLKSGGAEMVIAEKPISVYLDLSDAADENPNLVYCVWHDSYGRPYSKEYDYRNLVILED